MKRSEQLEFYAAVCEAFPNCDAELTIAGPVFLSFDDSIRQPEADKIWYFAKGHGFEARIYWERGGLTVEFARYSNVEVDEEGRRTCTLEEVEEDVKGHEALFRFSLKTIIPDMSQEVIDEIVANVKKYMP